MSDLKAKILSQVAGDKLVPLIGFEGVFIRQVALADVDALLEHDDLEGNDRLILASLCDSSRAAIFTADDIAELKRLKVGVWAGIVAQVNRANSVDAEAIEALAKN